MIKTYNISTDSIVNVLNRSQLNKKEINESVSAIVSDVQKNGDTALFRYTSQFDKLDINKDNIAVTEEEIDKAFSEVSPQLLASLKRAIDNVYNYHLAHKSNDSIIEKDGCKTGILVRPLARAGVYVPGGTAAYPSSVLMTVLPARAAGVKDIIMCSPNPKNPLTLVAARLSGVKTIYKVGGAQAISAMAYGTESIPKVDVITGPGNIYVTLAKKEVFGSVKIDMIAGPSEILVIADSSANPSFVAGDLLSQAEHDILSASILITTDAELAKKVELELERMTALLPRRAIIEQSLATNGAIIIVDSLATACKISNSIAPEHLELAVDSPDDLIPLIDNAGAIFCGHYTPEPLGDYFAGPSHVLPTSGTAKHFEVLNTDTYLKKVSYISYTKSKLLAVADDIMTLAKAEGFDAHSQSVNQRVLANKK